MCFGSPVRLLERRHTFYPELPDSRHEKGYRTSLERWFRGQLIEQGRPGFKFFLFLIKKKFEIAVD